MFARHRAPNTGRKTLAYYLALPAVWGKQFFHNAKGICHVCDILYLRPMKAGLIPPDHPFVTGTNPATGRPIWHQNILFRSPRGADAGGRPLPDDDLVVQKVGGYLAGMVSRSAVVPEIPSGPRRRMPHAINYIHGGVHYNSGILLFNDFADSIYHFTDRKFAAEVRRFAREEKREVLLMFRQRRYTTRQYAYFVAFLRSILPWFSNSNGPRKRVLWGNPSPFPVVNIICGNWVRDVYPLMRPGGAEEMVRPPIAVNRYFRRGAYRGVRREGRWPEKLVAQFWYQRIRMRGSRGGLFFVDRRQLLAEKLERLRREGAPDEPIAAGCRTHSERMKRADREEG